MSAKGIAIFRAKPGVSPESVQAWLSGANALAAAAPLLRRYVVNLVLEVVHGGQGVCGVAEAWFDSKEAMEEVRWLSKPFGVLDAGGAESPVALIDALEVEERVVLTPLATIAATPPAIKRVTFLKRNPGVTEEAFRAWYLGRHAGDTKTIPGLGGYVTNLVRREANGGLGLQAVPMFWFADQAAYATYYDPSRPLMKKVVEGTAPMVTRVRQFRVEERIIMPRPR